MRSNIFDRLSFWSLFLSVILLPLFVLPFTNIPVETSKGLLLVVGLAISIIFWSIARFSDGKINIPRSWLLASGAGIVLIFLLSSLFSANAQVSMFGIMFDISSFWFVFASFILMLMCAVVFRTPQQAKIVLLGTILSSALVLVFQGLHLFLPNKLSLGILAGGTGNILGSWNALGLFAGFSTLLFLLVIEFFSISKIEKLFLEIFIVLSVLLVAVVNFPLVWALVGISSLILFVYEVSISFHQNESNDDKKRFPLIPFVILMVSLLFFLNPAMPGTNTPFGALLPNLLKINNSEVSPSFGATLSITKGVIAKHPIFGIGPNRFGEAWSMYKPQSINNTQFWDVSFNSGAGLLPTFMSTTGILGILAWLAFLVLFFIAGVKSIFSSIKHGINWEIMAFFILSLYLFISSFFYFTGAVIFLIAFAFTGVFIGLVTSHSGKELEVSFLNDHRKSFFSILVLILVVILSASASFKYIERLTSVSYFSKALSSETEPKAEEFIGKALSLYTNDLYLRTYSQIYLIKLNSIANKGSNLSDKDKADLQEAFNQVLNSAQMATSYDSSNYLNFQLLGSVYQSAGTLGVKDAYGKAVTAYESASNLNPLNPGLKLAIAGTSFADGKVQNAKDYANQALNLKQDYVNALVTLSQLAKSENNNSQAISYAEAALSLSPNDKDLIQYINSLKNPSSTSNVPATSDSTTNKSKN